MKKTVILSALISILLTGLAGCSIAPPVIQITGDKTVIERQIVGEYMELEKDAWETSSVKTAVGKKKTGAALTSCDRELLAAMKVREFHREKIREYKNIGALGESNTGYIEYRTTDRVEKDKPLRAFITRLVAEENRARKTIFIRSLVLMLKKEAPEAEVAGFGRLFAGEQRKIAQKNDWIQEKTGRWEQK